MATITTPETASARMLKLDWRLHSGHKITESVDLDVAVEALGRVLEHSANVQCLKIQGQLPALPASIVQLSLLQELHLIGCCTLEALPEAIGHLEELRILVLAGCYALTALPLCLGHLKHLEVLSVSGGTSLAAVPKSIGCLTALQVLRLEQCVLLTTLPSEIGNLTSLQILDIRGCVALHDDVPERVAECVSLKSLICTAAAAAMIFKVDMSKASKMVEIAAQLVVSIAFEIGVLTSCSTDFETVEGWGHHVLLAIIIMMVLIFGMGVVGSIYNKYPQAPLPEIDSNRDENGECSTHLVEVGASPNLVDGESAALLHFAGSIPHSDCASDALPSSNASHGYCAWAAGTRTDGTSAHGHVSMKASLVELTNAPAELTPSAALTITPVALVGREDDAAREVHAGLPYVQLWVERRAVARDHPERMGELFHLRSMDAIVKCVAIIMLLVAVFFGSQFGLLVINVAESILGFDGDWEGANMRYVKLATALVSCLVVFGRLHFDPSFQGWVPTLKCVALVLSWKKRRSPLDTEDPRQAHMHVRETTYHMHQSV